MLAYLLFFFLAVFLRVFQSSFHLFFSAGVVRLVFRIVCFFFLLLCTCYPTRRKKPPQTSRFPQFAAHSARCFCVCLEVYRTQVLLRRIGDLFGFFWSKFWERKVGVNHPVRSVRPIFAAPPDLYGLSQKREGEAKEEGKNCPIQSGGLSLSFLPT